MFNWDGIAIAVDQVAHNEVVQGAVAANKKRKMLLYVAAAVIAIGVILFLRKR